MIIHRDQNITILYGNRALATHIIPKGPLPDQVYFDAQNILDHHKISVHDIVHTDQTHGIAGYIIQSIHDIPLIKNKEGDFLISTTPQIALGILTADCASIVIKSNHGRGVALIHAGWRGATQGVVPRTFEQFLAITQEDPTSCTIFLGPSARSCCYQIDEPFLEKIHAQPYENKESLIFRQGSWYFDNPTYIIRQLSACGVPDTHIHRGYNECTICNDNWCSYRRNPASNERQFTLVTLHPS